MRKVVLVLVLAALIAGGVSAQANVKNNWLSGEVSLVGVGLRYEYMLGPKFSLGVNAYLHTLFFWNDWGFNANARFYPFGKAFFAELGAGLGFHSGFQDITYIVDGREYTDPENWVGITGFCLVPSIGWKLDVGGPGGFFINPGIKLPITMGQKELVASFWWDNYYKSEFGVGVGFLIYCGFGYAF